ncbi:hypothetical protein FB566_5194 [Stackebrandtia endophytica]|uniref:NADH:quinone oxidoreductase/Mrp antiporter membrane subunit domain-containing protein n=1 Tax=Stackebrandtia endophytica TaxID=1496996 RepID=A0A543B427_9ACTN|nr:hypothetical protein [Stackebrandtia endophytica]TQL79584.1 hypothetical protein FB566_5194 [Stackebrandtia endophytica]
MNPMLWSVGLPVAAAAAYLVLGWRNTTRWFAVMAGGATLIWSATTVALSSPQSPHHASALFVLAISAAAVLAFLALPARIDAELADQKMGDRAAAWSAALTVSLLAVAILTVTVTDLGLSWLVLTAGIIPTAALMTYQRTPSGRRAARRLVRASVPTTLGGLVAVVLYWFGEPSAMAMLLLGAVLIAHAVAMPAALARTGVMSQLPSPSPILVFVTVPAAAAAVVVRWSGQAAFVLGVTGVRTFLLVTGIVILLAATAAMLWSRDLRSLLGYAGCANGGFAVLLAAAGPASGNLVAGYLLAFGAIAAALLIATADVVTVVGSSDLRLVGGWSGRSRPHATVMTVALAALAGIPIWGVWLSTFEQWGGVTPLVGFAAVVMAAAVFMAGRRILGQAAAHPHLASRRLAEPPAGLPVMTAGVGASVLLVVTGSVWLV